MAEWSWNLNGRSPEQLALAWATRQGYPRPDQAAAWLSRMDPLETLLLGGPLGPGAPSGWKEAVGRLKAGQPPETLRGLWEAPSATNALREALAICREALPIAEATGAPEFVLETRYIMGVLDALQALHALLTQAARPEAATTAGRPAVQAQRDKLAGAIAVLTDVMHQRLDLLNTCAPATIEKRKRLHDELWQQRLADIDAALASQPEAPPDGTP